MTLCSSQEPVSSPGKGKEHPVLFPMGNGGFGALVSMEEIYLAEQNSMDDLYWGHQSCPVMTTNSQACFHLFTCLGKQS